MQLQCTSSLCFSNWAQIEPSFSDTGKSTDRCGSSFDPKMEIICPNMLRKPCCFLRGITLPTLTSVTMELTKSLSEPKKTLIFYLFNVLLTVHSTREQLLSNMCVPGRRPLNGKIRRLMNSVVSLPSHPPRNLNTIPLLGDPPDFELPRPPRFCIRP